MALARYWLDGATAIAAVQDQHPGSCHRVRYEDLVADPERVAAGIFDFLGVGQVPGIGEAVFAGEHERFGPADHKIWYTSAISSGSVGRSDALPVGLIPPPILESINGLLDKLGYVRVDESWGTADMPDSLLAPEGEAEAKEQEHSAPPPEAEDLADRLAAGLTRLDADRWEAHMAESFTVVIRQPSGTLRTWWHVDLRTRAFIHQDEHDEPAVTNADSPDDDGDETDWSIVGTAETWLRLLNGNVNISVALRRNELRYCDYGDNDFFVSDARISLLADLLGMPSLAQSTAVRGEHVPAMADRR